MCNSSIKKKGINIVAALMLSAALIGSNFSFGQAYDNVVYAESVSEENGTDLNIAASEIVEDGTDIVAETIDDCESEGEPSESPDLETEDQNAQQTEEAEVEELLAEDPETETKETEEISDTTAIDTAELYENLTEDEAQQEEASDGTNTDSSNAGESSEEPQSEALNDDTDNQGTDAGSTTDTNQTKPILTLRSMSLAKTYDGKALSNGDTALEVETGWKDGDGADYIFTETQTAIGSTLNKFTITPWEGTDLNEYTLDISYGDLTVTERLASQKYILTITGTSGNVMYSGQEQTLSGYTLSGRSGYEYRVEGSGDPAETLSFTIGDAAFSVTGISASGRGTSAGSYLVDISGSPVVYDAYGNNVTGEFSFEYYAGTLTIDKRSVILTSDSGKKKYDGKVLKKHNVTVSGDGFIQGEGATYTFTGKQKDVGVSYNYFDYVLNAGTSEANYTIEKVPGKLKVTKADDTEDSSESTNSSDTSGSSDGGSGDSTGSASSQEQNSTDSSSSSTISSATTVAQDQNMPDVLGAMRPIDSENNSADDGRNQEDDIKVLGARRGSTEDNTADTVFRFNIMFAAAIVASILIRRNKRYNNE